MSFLSGGFTGEQQELLKEFLGAIEKEVGPPQDPSYRYREAARYLKSRKFDLKEALKAILKFYEFRATNEIDLILKGEFTEEPDIRQALPHCLHHTDAKGRVLMILKLGEVKTTELFEGAKLERLLYYFVRCVQLILREVVPLIAKKQASPIMEEIVLIVDLKGGKMKELSNKQLHNSFKLITRILSNYYPQVLHHVHVVNTPMFFSPIFQELSPSFNPSVLSKITQTGAKSQKEIQTSFDPNLLPAEYGGKAKLLRDVFLRDQGSWIIDQQVKVQNGKEGQFVEDGLDQAIIDDQDQMDGELDGLRSALSKNIPHMSMGLPMNKFQAQKAGDVEEAEEEIYENLEDMLSGAGLQGLPGMTPMNTQAAEDDSPTH